jgi:phosphatidylethanolamine/phosphatidyl-N-methylethanolamine N-methyltransferase
MAAKPRLESARPSLAKLERDGGKIVGIGHIEEDVVKVAYRRWAPVYDHTFGAVSTLGRRAGVEVLNSKPDGSSILEVGVGTGLSLSNYKNSLKVTGIDLSPEMLEKARDKVIEEKLTNVVALQEMDASDLQYPDSSFDTTVAMFVMTVVPEPEKVMLELARVTKPGGEVMLVNHFSRRARLG